jgi:hypothetical protein
MDMGFDHAAWPQQGDDPVGGFQPFDWQGLRARFLAAHACRGEIGQERAAPAQQGSFDSTVAAALAGFERDTPGVNPNGLGDRKADRAIEQMTPGQRGPAIEGDND